MLEKYLDDMKFMGDGWKKVMRMKTNWESEKIEKWEKVGVNAIHVN